MPNPQDTEKYCYFVIGPDEASEVPASSEIQNSFIKGTLPEKKANLKRLIRLVANDETYPRLLMPVLTNLQMLQDHEMKKLLLLYWEVVEKLKVDGEVKDEIILACNALRKDLLSPNEFVRGRTLRLVAKIPIESIMENLIQAVNDNLVHRHYYVRRNAIMTLYAVYKNFGSTILEESDEKIENLLQQETDLSTRRNAFLLLFHLNKDKALTYLRTLMS